MTPMDMNIAVHNRAVIAIGDKDGKKTLIMLRNISIPR